MKLYDKIKDLLTHHVAREALRNSDRKLIWEIWQDEGMATDFTINYENFLDATSPETIRRTRQKVQQDHPELQSDKKILEMKKKIEDQKGTFVYRELFREKLI